LCCGKLVMSTYQNSNDQIKDGREKTISSERRQCQQDIGIPMSAVAGLNGTLRHDAWDPRAHSAGAAMNLVWFGCCRSTGAGSLLEPKFQNDRWSANFWGCWAKPQGRALWRRGTCCQLWSTGSPEAFHRPGSTPSPRSASSPRECRNIVARTRRCCHCWTVFILATSIAAFQKKSIAA
jgi:hypothetical protein